MRPTSLWKEHTCNKTVLSASCWRPGAGAALPPGRPAPPASRWRRGGPSAHPCCAHAASPRLSPPLPACPHTPPAESMIRGFASDFRLWDKSMWAVGSSGHFFPFSCWFHRPHPPRLIKWLSWDLPGLENLSSSTLRHPASRREGQGIVGDPAKS